MTNERCLGLQVLHEKKIFFWYGILIKKGEIMMGIEIDWTLIVLIGILVCLVHMAISLVDLRAGNRMDMDTLYKETSTINKTIKDEIGGVKIVMRELG